MNEKKATFDLPENTAAALCYVLGWISGLVFFLSEKENQKIRFNALQSIILFGGLSALMLVPGVGWVMSPFLMLLSFVLWLVLVVKTYQGGEVNLPLVSDFVRKQLQKKQ